MTEQEQQTFMERLEVALSWMKDVQERLRANDDTQGPLNALEARLRETEKIHQSEHEGRVKMDMALVASEHLLEIGDEQLKSHIQAKLKDLKSCWEETCTYIIHCHSRIEWVWLHWSEYLKAQQEFLLWLMRQQRDLDIGVELQLGLKEKLWKVDQQRVVVSDVHGQEALLERLLDEAAVLHNRTQDPSVEPQVQEKLQQAYNDIRDKVEDRLSLLQAIAEEHQTYQGSVHQFQLWLLSKTKELTDLMEKDDTTENKLQALKALDDIVASEEKTLQYIEGVAETVRVKTSPAGAEVVVEEAEELRLGWQRLRQGLCEVEESLHNTMSSHGEYMSRCQRLDDDIGCLRLRLHGLNQELEEDHDVCDGADCSEEQMMGQWRKYERLLKDSIQLQDRLNQLKTKGDLLGSLFGPERSDDLQSELSTAIRNRELMHVQLLQRKGRLEGLISRTKDFGEAYILVRSKLTSLRDAMTATKGLLPDILAKKSQADQFRVIQKDLEDCEAPIKALENLISGCQSNQTQFEQLFTDWKYLKKTVEVNLHESEKSIVDHAHFHDNFLNIEKWCIVMKQKLESFKIPTGEWSLESREDEAQRALGEFPEKKIQLQQMEILAEAVLKRTSEEGRVHIVGDMKRLQGLWLALYTMSLNIHRLLNGSINETLSTQTEISFEEVDNGCTDHTENQLILPGIQDEHLKLSGKGMGSRSSYVGDVDDLSVGTVLTQAGQQPLAEDSPVDTNLNSDISRGHDSHTMNTASEGAAMVLSHQEATMSPEEGGMTMKESLSQGGGVFMLFRHDPANQQVSTSTQGTMMDTDQYQSKKREFEAWLCRENELLSGILNTKRATRKCKEFTMQQDTLSALRSGVTWGQEQFQLLLQGSGVKKSGSGQAADTSLEELRYRWMLYKSKLKAAGDLQTRLRSKKVTDKQRMPATGATVYKKPGLLQRVCRVALPLWLLFLAFLLLAFLLPLMDEGNSCSISNNFARSFSVMLRYSGPPPT
ncbi:nesprin-3 isoform X5 [Hippocampus comes]|uniref:nesprin-3 isoform X5 n=1 Tax=Hippocampus comes TaxID=109280 RepID=UPI00094E6F65|nr:PREDICTED: nesprin-3 isoform X5 [Hippocampus comes]